MMIVPYPVVNVLSSTSKLLANPTGKTTLEIGCHVSMRQLCQLILPAGYFSNALQHGVPTVREVLYFRREAVFVTIVLGSKRNILLDHGPH
jgi:hypothetical protein